MLELPNSRWEFSGISIQIAKKPIIHLQNFQLDFATYSNRWKGCSATIVAKKDSVVWGALWEIDNVHLESLDRWLKVFSHCFQLKKNVFRQEGVADNLYIPLTVNVETPEGKNLECRVYQQTATFPTLEDIGELPEDRRPSVIYLNTILKGAQESALPVEYQNVLKRIPHNGYDGKVDIGLPLNST